MENHCFFSIVIPTLNEEKFLPVLLKSLSTQSFRDFEVILVDAKSEDKTVKEFNKQQLLFPSSLIILSNKRNAGFQRNLGAKSAKGMYFIFLDGDCNVSSTFLEELHLSAIKRKYLFATTWIIPDSEKTVENLIALISNFLVEVSKIIKKQFSGGYNTIIRSDIFFRLNGYKENLAINEDCDLAVRAQRKGFEVVILKEPQVIFSMRRFRSFGTFRLLKKYIIAWIYNFMDIPITDVLFYPMGGHVHKTVRKRSLIRKIKGNLKRLERFQERISKLIE